MDTLQTLRSAAPGTPRARPRPSPVTTELELVERDLPEALVAGVADWLAQGVADLRVLVAEGDLERAFAAPSGSPGLTALGADVAMLGRAYARCAGEPVVDVRLERIEDGSCRAFHRDHVRLRLMTSYAGPGTEYVADADADDALRLQGRHRGQVHSVPTGAVAWVRGSQSAAGEGLVHRSPPIDESGLVRLFLAVNAPSAASPPLWTPGCGSSLARAARLV